MNNLAKLGKIYNGETIPSESGCYPAYGGNGIITYVDRYNYPENTIIIGRVGANCGAVYFSYGKCWVTDNALAFIVNEDNDPYFVYCLLRIINLNKFHIGSSQPLITQDIINKLTCDYITDLSVQKKISSFIQNIDKKLLNNNQIKDILSKFTDDLYDYWFVQFDFPNSKEKPYKKYEGKMTFSPELKQNIPEGWKFVHLGDIAKINTESINPQSGISYRHYSIPAFDEEMLPKTEDGEQIDSSKYIVPSQSILVSKLNPKFKRIWFINETNDNSICSTEFMPFCSDIVPVDYLYGVLNSATFHKFMMQGSTCSTGSRKRISPELCLEYKLVLPQKDILDKFTNIMNPIHKLRTKILNENKVLIGLRDKLLPFFMTGKIKFID